MKTTRTHKSTNRFTKLHKPVSMLIALAVLLLTGAVTHAQDNGNSLIKAAFVKKATPQPKETIFYRDFSGAWHDSKGKLWIFGGFGEDADGKKGLLNDFWMWDGKRWNLLSGSTVSGKAGVYTTLTANGAALTPGARINPNTWMDEEGILWLQGGYGRDSHGSVGNLNDLWKWNGAKWTWVSGSKHVIKPRRG